MGSTFTRGPAARMPLCDVVPAKAGTHTPCTLDKLRRMGPGALAGTTRNVSAQPRTVLAGQSMAAQVRPPSSETKISALSPGGKSAKRSRTHNGCHDHLTPRHRPYP